MSTVHAVGFSAWKRPIVRDFLAEHALVFVPDAAAVPAGAVVALWGCAPAPHHAGAVLRLEDGFLRSVGLGAELVRPLSWVVDRRGMYYDATTPSDLEVLLQTHGFDADLHARAGALRERIVAEGITKYNLGPGGWQRPPGAKPVVLVVGQVETDASIAWGAPGPVRGNVELLHAVRAARPDAHLVFKPHPDVVARLRRAGAGEERAAAFCDEVLTGVPMHTLLAQVDEVHVLTSLAGFEALLRGRPVVTWGQPFYAGWGLTDDRVPVARRTRRLVLDELVAAALILYPRYLARHGGALITPEAALDELVRWRAEAPRRTGAWPALRRWALGAYNRAIGR